MQILKWVEQSELSFTSFIPAAGAASRFFRPLAETISAIEENDYEKFTKEWQEIKKYPLPSSIRALETKDNFESEAKRSETLRDLRQPKALMPCNTESCFLEEKIKELDSYGFIAKKSFVVPDGKKGAFSKFVSDSKTSLYAQDASLSTLRYDDQGNVLFSGDKPSVAPAGHGALHALFPRLKDEGHKHLFIQNIDNLTGTSKDVCTALQDLSNYYAYVLKHLNIIRLNIESDRSLAETAASDLLGWIKTEQDKGNWISALHHLFYEVFNRPLATSLEEASSGSLQVLGMVPNKKGLVGGIPFFWNSNEGETKICLEGPHISEDAKQNLKTKASFFNPVTVFSELSARSEPFQKTSTDFWFVADKTYAGRRALYQETALYELLSDSRYHNVLFVELPAATFNPHKTLLDCT